MSFDEHRYELGTLTAESVWLLGMSGNELVDQLATSLVGGGDNGDLRGTVVAKDRLLQIIFVTTRTGGYLSSGGAVSFGTTLQGV